MPRYRTTITSNQLIAPSLRMVAVEVTLQANGTGFDAIRDVHPVVALSSFVVNAAKLDGDFEVPKSQSSEVHHQALIVHSRDGCLTEFEEMPLPETSMRLVVCPWPQSEDEDRLAKVADEMELELRDYISRHPATPEATHR